MEDPTLGSDDKVCVGTALETTRVQMLRRRVMRMDLAMTMMMGGTGGKTRGKTRAAE